MTEFESFVTTELAKIASNTAATKASLDGLNDRLFEGPASVITTLQADIAEVKANREKDERWEKIHNIAHYSLTPLLALAHGIARHFGVDI